MDEWQELQVALLEKNTGISKGDTYHAQVTVKISELAFDVQHDLWLDWAPPPSCEISQQKTFVTGRVHLKLWKSFELYVRTARSRTLPPSPRSISSRC